MEAKRLGFGAETRSKIVRGPWVWGGLARSDRRFEGNRRAQIAGLVETGAV